MVEVELIFDIDVLAGIESSLSQKAEMIALRSTDRATRRLVQTTRSKMQAAGLGRLGFAIGQSSDLKRGNGVYRRGNGEFSASGTLFVRSRSPRSIGALESYLDGATIRPRSGGLLWFPTDEIRRRVGVPLPSTGGNGRANIRLEPRYWNRTGLDRKIGPLVRVTGKDGTPLLIVENVAVSASGRPRSARRLNRNGAAPKNFIQKDFIVAFIGIPQTVRTRRLDLLAEALAERSRMADEIAAEFR
jgi:hypothetical protein